MRTLFINVIFFVYVFAANQHPYQAKCKPKYHFWRPYNGTAPEDALIAGFDDDGIHNFVAKIIPPDHYSWTVPVQLKEYTDHVDIAWHESKNIMTVDHFIEVLCAEDPDKLKWVKVKYYIDEVVNKCCFVQGGIGVFDNKVYNAFIAKGTSNGELYIGRVYVERGWDGVHIMYGKNSTKILKNFEVLTYGCTDDSLTNTVN